MSEVITVLKGAKSAIGYLKAWLDPGMRRRLDEAIETHLLEEIPRIVRLLEERIADVQASGCTPVEANIIAHQVIEAQRRTLDDDKRRRLSNVLVNGFCAPTWNKVRLRLLVRLTSELEEEHIEVLRLQSRTPEEWIRDLEAQSSEPRTEWSFEKDREERAVARALDRELIARGLLSEDTKPKVTMQKLEVMGRRPAVEKVELETKVSITQLGCELLNHLRDPESTVA